jgi:hypothetical protein
MKKLDRWALNASAFLYQENTVLGYKLGAREMREKICDLILLNDNLDYSKELMDMVQNIQGLGEDEEEKT